MLANREEGARHLSSNEEVHHYVAGPAEKMDKHVGDYRAKIEEGESAFGKWLGEVTKASSKFGQVFNHKETVLYLETLREYRPHYNMDPIFSVAFCLQHLHNVYGGVSDTSSVRILEYSLRRIHARY
jgi:hypothetical protein